MTQRYCTFSGGNTTTVKYSFYFCCKVSLFPAYFRGLSIPYFSENDSDRQLTKQRLELRSKMLIYDQKIL